MTKLDWAKVHRTKILNMLNSISNWIKKKSISSTKTKKIVIRNEIESFKRQFFSDTSRSKSSAGMISTWQSAYKPYLNRLIGVSHKSTLKLNQELLVKILLSYKENSRSRQQCGIALSALAKEQLIASKYAIKAMKKYKINKDKPMPTVL